MHKRALAAVTVFLGCCLSLSAQTPEQFLFDGVSLSRPYVPVPSLNLADQDRFFLSTSFGAMQSASNFLPTFDPKDAPGVAPSRSSRNDSAENMVDFRSPDRIQFGGEFGFLYGKSTGKYGREDFQTYIIGTVGNDKFSITAGYLRQESSGHIPTTRWNR